MVYYGPQMTEVDDVLWRCIRANRRATVDQLTVQMNQEEEVTNSVSRTTVKRTLLRMGIVSRHLVRSA